MDLIRESTPVNDPHEVSVLLKNNPISPNVNSHFTNVGSAVSQSGTPSSLPPLPPSPTRSILSVIPHPRVDNIVGMVKEQEEIVLQNTGDLVVSLRSVSSLEYFGSPLLLTSYSFSPTLAIFGL